MASSSEKIGYKVLERVKKNITFVYPYFEPTITGTPYVLTNDTNVFSVDTTMHGVNWFDIEEVQTTNSSNTYNNHTLTITNVTDDVTATVISTGPTSSEESKAFLLNSSYSDRTLTLTALQDFELSFLNEQYPNWKKEIIVINRASSSITINHTGAALQLAYFDGSGTQQETTTEFTDDFCAQVGDALDYAHGYRPDPVNYPDWWVYPTTRIFRITVDDQYRGYNRLRLKYKDWSSTAQTVSWSDYIAYMY